MQRGIREICTDILRIIEKLKTDLEIVANNEGTPRKWKPAAKMAQRHTGMLCKLGVDFRKSVEKSELEYHTSLGYDAMRKWPKVRKMALTCECDEIHEEYWTESSPEYLFRRMYERYRRARCASCKKFIEQGDTVLPFDRFRAPRTSFEEKLHGDFVPMTEVFYCQECAEIYLNLSDLGYCITHGGDMHEFQKEYWELTGFDPAKYTKSSVEAEG